MLSQIGGQALSNCRIKHISENNTINAEDSQEKQIEIVFETLGKTDKIQLSGNGSLKVSTPV